MSLYGPTVLVEAEAGGLFQGKTYEASFQEEKTNQNLIVWRQVRLLVKTLELPKKVFLILKLGPI